MKKDDEIFRKIDELIEKEINFNSVDIQVDLVEEKLNQGSEPKSFLLNSDYLPKIAATIIVLICASMGFISMNKKDLVKNDPQEIIYFNEITLENMERSILNP